MVQRRQWSHSSKPTIDKEKEVERDRERESEEEKNRREKNQWHLGKKKVKRESGE